MGSVEDHHSRSRELARRFLRTAVVVDDEAYIESEGGDGPPADVVTPDRRSRTSSKDSHGPGRRSQHSLDARAIMGSFSSLGVICGVVGPMQSALEAVRQADVVVLDWLLQDDDSKYTLDLLRELLTGESERNSLRLVAIYTGVERLEDIYKAVFDDLERHSLDPIDDGSQTTIPYRHGRLVLYAKSAVNLPDKLKTRRVEEADLAGKLLEDFASMTEGLLPGIALTSLTAVREGEHKLLDRFCAELDPAFLAHMACLTDPEEAELQIVTHVVEELRGLVDETVAAESPAGKQAAESWIRSDGRDSFKFGDREQSQDQTVDLVTNGLKKSSLGDSAFKSLSSGFADCDAVDLDERLAWIMCFRTIYNEPPPMLWLGSVLTTKDDGDEEHLICMRPRCDSVRLDEETAFVFLPLVQPRRGLETQLVVMVDNELKRLGIELVSASLVLRRFKPSDHRGAVVASKQALDDDFLFTDTCNRKYVWQGELKAEYAQRISHTFATNLSRVAVDESEWLRRLSGKS